MDSTNRGVRQARRAADRRAAWPDGGADAWHVAGYSFDGKVNGVEMIYRAARRFTERKPDWDRASAFDRLRRGCQNTTLRWASSGEASATCRERFRGIGFRLPPASG